MERIGGTRVVAFDFLIDFLGEVEDTGVGMEIVTRES